MAELAAYRKSLGFARILWRVGLEDEQRRSGSTVIFVSTGTLRALAGCEHRYSASTGEQAAAGQPIKVLRNAMELLRGRERL